MNQNINILFTNVKRVVLKLLKDPKRFIEFSNDIKDVYRNINDCNL